MGSCFDRLLSSNLCFEPIHPLTLTVLRSLSQALDCKDKPYDQETMLRNVTEAKSNDRGGQPKEDRGAKRKKGNDDRSEMLSKRAGGTEGEASCSAQKTSELMHETGNLELTEALGEGVRHHLPGKVSHACRPSVFQLQKDSR